MSALQKGVGFNAASQPQTTEALNKATGGMDYMSLLKILGMANSGSQTQSKETPQRALRCISAGRYGGEIQRTLRRRSGGVRYNKVAQNIVERIIVECSGVD